VGSGGWAAAHLDACGVLDSNDTMMRAEQARRAVAQLDAKIEALDWI
jgi:hypothetical protein